MSKVISAVIVEDEEASRETLQNYLIKYCPQVELKGMGANIKEGKALIEEHNPQLVFLDVEMPFGNAFDLLEDLGEVKFETIFITAYSNYAIKALNFSASYYILKPIDIDELISAVEKVGERLNDESPLHTNILIENIKAANQQLQKVVLPMLDGFEVIQVKDIVRCQANDNFTDFHLIDGTKHVICRTLKFYEEVLTDFDFMRVHKSHLINLQHLKKYRKGKGGQAIMIDGSEVEVSATKKKDLIARF